MQSPPQSSPASLLRRGEAGDLPDIVALERLPEFHTLLLLAMLDREYA